MKDFKSVGKLVEGNEGDKCHYNLRLDTYGCGCQHDCKYCYAKSLLDFRGLWDSHNPSVGYMPDIEKAIRKIPVGQVVRIGGMTDCFQPLEKVHRVTYKTIRILNKYRREYLIVTKSAMIGDDEYIRIMDKDLAHIQVTVTTDNDELARKYEKASPPNERIKSILKLQELGYDVAIRISPFIPAFWDFERLNAYGFKKACIEFLRINTWVAKWFGDMVDMDEYTIKQSGYRHLPLNKKKEYIGNIHIPEMTVCEDEDRAYQYWKYHFNRNPEDCCNLRRNNA